MKLEKETALYNENAIKNAIEEKTQFFWNNSSGEFAGTHVTEIPESDFITTPTGGNLWLNSDEMSLRYGEDVRLYTSKIIENPVVHVTDNNRQNYTGTFYSDGDPYFFIAAIPFGDRGEFECKELRWCTLLNFKLYLPGVISGQPVWPGSGMSANLILDEYYKASSGHTYELYNNGSGKTVNVCWTEQDNTLFLRFYETGLNNYSYEVSWNRINMAFIPYNLQSSTTILGRHYAIDETNPPLLGCLSANDPVYKFKVEQDGKIYGNNLIINNHNDPIGTVQNSAWTSSLQYGGSSNWRYLNGYSYIDLSPGVYVVDVYVRFNTTISGGFYGISVGHRESTSWDYYYNSRVSMKSSGGTIQLTTSYITNLDDWTSLTPGVYGDETYTLGRFNIRSVRIV